MRTWNSNNIHDTFEIFYASKEEGQQLISSENTYINNLTQFDLDCRCGHANATKEDYIALCKESVRNFLSVEIERLEETLAENFRLAVLGTIEELPNPEIIERIRDVMKAS